MEVDDKLGPNVAEVEYLENHPYPQVGDTIYPKLQNETPGDNCRTI